MLHFITDAVFETAEGEKVFLPQPRSSYKNDYNSLAVPGIQVRPHGGPELVNGNFWVGSKYLLAGVWEFQKGNVLNLNRMEQLAADVKNTFTNAAAYPLVWVGAAEPLLYKGAYYYLPFLHLDDFMCPIADTSACDVFTYAEINPEYCVEEGCPAHADTLGMYQTLLARVEQKLLSDLNALNVKARLIKLPVLFDSFLNKIYSYTNCLVEQVNGTTVLHLPEYRKNGDVFFNRVAHKCEMEIAARLQGIAAVEFIRGYDFATAVGEGMGSLHCLLSPFSKTYAR